VIMLRDGEILIDGPKQDVFTEDNLSKAVWGRSAHSSAHGCFTSTIFYCDFAAFLQGTWREPARAARNPYAWRSMEAWSPPRLQYDS